MGGLREDIGLTTIQPSVSCNFEHGWYVPSSPIVTANWEADGDDSTRTAPVGGGVGRLIRLGRLPANLQTQTLYHVVKPDDGPTSNRMLRLQVQLLFPKRKAWGT